MSSTASSLPFVFDHEFCLRTFCHQDHGIVTKTTTKYQFAQKRTDFASCWGYDVWWSSGLPLSLLDLPKTSRPWARSAVRLSPPCFSCPCYSCNEVNEQRERVAARPMAEKTIKKYPNNSYSNLINKGQVTLGQRFVGLGKGETWRSTAAFNRKSKQGRAWHHRTVVRIINFSI